MNIVVWFLLLMLQNAAFTWVSRARNSGSIGYHAVAAIASNGIFFVTNLILIRVVTTEGAGPAALATTGLIYVAGTVSGSVLMHVVSMRYLERGKRKVGSQ